MRSVTRRAVATAWCAGALALAGCQSKPSLPIEPIGGDFALTDHHGAPFELASQRGKVVLIFFGYSMCPDVCPTTLSKLSSVMSRLGADKAKVKTIYVTIDPERDTPEVLKADLDNFTLDAVGLTGTRAQVDAVAKLYGATYSIVPTPTSAAKYTVTHSTLLYALDARGKVRLIFKYEATVDEIVAGVKAILAEGE